MRPQTLPNGLKLDSVSGGLLAPIERLRPDPNQPRKHFDPDELAALKKDIEGWAGAGRGIAATGFLQPILGRWEPGAIDASGNVRRGARIDIVDGERRWRACQPKRGQNAVIKWVPVVIDDMPASEARDAAMRSNIHRSPLQPIEEAQFFAGKMDEMGWGIRPVARFYNVATGYIENRLALLGMSEDVQALVGTRPDTLSSARVIDKVKNRTVRASLIEDATEGASFKAIKEKAEPFITRDTKSKPSARVPRIDVAAYLDGSIYNAEQVRDALNATPLPKSAHNSIVAPRLKKLAKLLDELAK